MHICTVFKKGLMQRKVCFPNRHTTYLLSTAGSALLVVSAANHRRWRAHTPASVFLLQLQLWQPVGSFYITCFSLHNLEPEPSLTPSANANGNIFTSRLFI